MPCLRIHHDLLSARGPQLNFAVLRAHQPEDETDHRRLALSGRSYQSDDLARVRLKGRIRDHPVSLHIRKVHALHPDLEALIGILIHLAALGDMHLSRELDQLADTVRGH